MHDPQDIARMSDARLDTTANLAPDMTSAPGSSSSHQAARYERPPQAVAHLAGVLLLVVIITFLLTITVFRG